MILSVLKRLFGREPDEIDAVLDTADFLYVRARLVETFSTSVIPSRLATALDAFVANPSRATARKLIEFDPRFLAVFSHTAQSSDFTASLGLDPYSARKTSAELQIEPGFEDLVEAFVDDRGRYDAMVVEYEAKGYTADTIRKAIAEHFQDLDIDA